jgi:hypothetical protein
VQQRVGTDKLTVVLLDVDPAYYKMPAQYLPQAQKILQRHKLDWPNAIAPKGWDDPVHIFNLSGYGNIVVDAEGIVRGVNLHDKELERAVDAMVGKQAER